MSYARCIMSVMNIGSFWGIYRIHELSRLLILLILISFTAGCSRQFAVTVNDQSVYDPRIPPNTLVVKDADLQGCLNLALRQQPSENPLELTVLSCANANILELDGIEQFTGLRFLDVAGNRITNLQPLSGMAQLSGLSIINNPITDISALLNMPGLTVAILSGNEQVPCSQLDRLEAQLGDNLTRPASCQ